MQQMPKITITTTIKKYFDIDKDQEERQMLGPLVKEASHSDSLNELKLSGWDCLHPRILKMD